jgi:hypothetical protein
MRHIDTFLVPVAECPLTRCNDIKGEFISQTRFQFDDNSEHKQISKNLKTKRGQLCYSKPKN